MAFNKGYELKKFEAHWEKLRIEYAAAGMAEDAIQKMYDYDRQQFNSERTCIDVYRGYQIHVDFNFDLAQYLENSDELAC